VCTFALCAIRDERRAVGEIIRVLRPGGLLLLADHIAAATWPVRGLQRVLELATVPLQGEHMLRRALRQVQAEGLQIERRERFKAGMVEPRRSRACCNPVAEMSRTVKSRKPRSSSVLVRGAAPPPTSIRASTVETRQSRASGATCLDVARTSSGVSSPWA
jgi:SAM-dependent methyltransferase